MSVGDELAGTPIESWGLIEALNRIERLIDVVAQV